MYMILERIQILATILKVFLEDLILPILQEHHMPN